MFGQIRKGKRVRRQSSQYGLGRITPAIEYLEQRLVLNSQWSEVAEVWATEPGTNFLPPVPYGPVAIPNTLAVSRAPTDELDFDINDVYQGSFDTCVFTSSLAAIAQTGSLSIESGGTGADLPDGDGTGAAAPTVFGVKLYKQAANGTYVPVIINVPFDYTIEPEDPRPADDNEFWPALYQRAYLTLVEQLNAQLPAGSQVNYKDSQFALATLTGVGTSVFNPAGGGLAEARRIETALNAGQPTLASTIDSPTRVLDGPYGIIHNHAYTVMGIEIPASGNLSQVYVTVRNPWGKDTAWEYFDTNHNGDLSITEFNASQAGVDGWNDGLVRMPWSAFIEYYNRVTISSKTGTSLNHPLKVNSPPVFTPQSVGPFTIHEGERLEVPLHAADPDGLVLVYYLSQESPGTVNLLSGNYVWSPPAGTVGTHSVTVIAEVSSFEKVSLTFTVNVTSGAPTIASLTSNRNSIGTNGNDAVTLTANNVALPFADTVDKVEFWRDQNGNGTFEEGSDFFLGYGTANGSNWSWSGYIGGVTPGSVNVFARAGWFSFSDLHYSNLVTKSLTVTQSPVIPPVATPGSNQFTISPTETFDQRAVDVVADPAGNIRAFWKTQTYNAQQFNYEYSFRTRLYDANGNALSSTQTLAVPNYAYDIDVAVLPDGSYVVAWFEYISYLHASIVAQRFTADGTPTGSQFEIVTDSAWAQNDYFEISADAAGNLLCVFNKGDYFSEDVWATSVSANGTVVRAPWQLNTYTNNSQKYPEVALNASGQGIIVWTDADQGKIMGRLVSEAGIVNSDEIELGTDATPYDQLIDVAVDAAGNFVVTWVDIGVRARRFDSAGQPLGAAFLVSTNLAASAYNPKVTLNSTGWMMFGWDSFGQDTGADPQYGVYAQLYDPAGQRAGGEFNVHNLFPDSQRLGGLMIDADADTTFLFTDAAGADHVVMRQFNVNVAPTFPANLTFNLAENSPNGTVVGSAAASDLDGVTGLVYSLVAGNQDNAFAINASTGQITVANDEVLNYEDNSLWTLSIRVVDPSGAATLTNVSVNLTDVNEAPDLLDLEFSLVENTASGVMVGSVAQAIDQDEDDGITYRILPGDDAALFVIDLNTGVIRVAPGATLNYEDNPHLSFTIKLTDSAGLFDTATVYVNLINRIEPPAIVPTSTPVKVTKKSGPAALLPDVTLDDSEHASSLALAGAQLVVSINRAQKKGKFFDTLSGFDQVSGLGDLISQDEVNGRTVFVIKLSDTVTTSAVEDYLQGLSFSTKGAGLKLTTRTLRVQLIGTDSATSNLVEKTISVSKK